VSRGERILDTTERRFRVYAYTLGLAAASVVLIDIGLSRDLAFSSIIPVLVFSLFIGVSWFFSFTIFPRARLSISLDMTYVMTALCVLPHPLPLAVALLGAVLGSCLRAREMTSLRYPFLPALALNTGGLVTAALAGRWVSLALAPYVRFAPLSWRTVALITALFVAYNITNLAVMGTAVVLKGEPVLPYLSHYLRYIPTLEIFTVPLCLGLALLYAGSGVWGFVPLGATIITASGLLKKLNRARSELSEANEQLQNRTRELRILYTIGNEITSSLDPQVVFSQISANVQRILDAPFLFLSLKHRGVNEPYLEFVARDGVAQTRQAQPLGEGFTNWMVDVGRALLVADIAVDRETLQCAPVSLDPAVRSIMAAPLMVQRETIGVLCVESLRPGAYTLDHLSILTTIAQQVAIAIENARNFQMAIVDQLTQLYLKDFFFRKLWEEQVRARRYGSTFAVLMLDLDRFKEINDQLGHMAGDRFLQRVGDAIRESMRSADVPCRYGGEEFCLLLPETDAEGARTIAERIRLRVATLEMLNNDEPLGTTISVGIACYPADYPGTINGFVERADRALYAAKQTGRNRIVMAADVSSVVVAPPPRAAARRPR
jgi:diguanylate cyclase (GGDEF)-like protein